MAKAKRIDCSREEAAIEEAKRRCGIDDDDIVPAVYVGCECRFVLSSENCSYGRCHSSESLALSVDNVPFTLHLSRLLNK